MAKKKIKDNNEANNNTQPITAIVNRLTEETSSRNLDETNDFDLTLEKKPALSTMKYNLKVLDKRLATSVPVRRFVQLFDKLKIAIDLKEFGEAIEFDFDLATSNMIESNTPEKPDTRADYKGRLYDAYSSISDAPEDVNLTSIPLDDFSIDDEDTETDVKHIDISHDEITNTTTALDENIYPNCKIEYHWRRKGLVNVYIKNDVLFIYLTGKIRETHEHLGYITRDNIHDILRDVCERAGIGFNINTYVQLALVYLCDACIDIELENVPRMIDAIGSLLPMASNRHRIMKYGRHGLKLKSKAKNTGSSLTFYSKGKETRERLKRALPEINLNKPAGQEITVEQLLTSYPDNIDNILRIEVQMYRLNDIRTLLNIPKGARGTVFLTDVLNSTAQPILQRLEAFGITEQTLRAKIFTYIENETKPKTKNKTMIKVREWLAGMGIVYLFSLNSQDASKVKSYIITEFGTDEENIISSLTTEIQHDYWNFLTYKKPKTIKKVIELLNTVHTYYGRNAENE